MIADNDKRKISKQEFLLEYFKTRPGQPLRASDVAEWIGPAYRQLTGESFRDVNRIIRYQYDRGILHRESHGVYTYYPGAVGRPLPPPFTESQKAEIFERDGRICAVCGKTEAEGVSLDVDHLDSRSTGGESIIENGAVLCRPHNNFKKNYGHTEAAKRFFKNLYRLAVKHDDTSLMSFIEEIMEVYGSHGYDDHISWSKDDY